MKYTHRTIKLRLFKSVLLGLAVPVICLIFWLWDSKVDGTSKIQTIMNEYELIRKASTSKGYVISAKEFAHEVETERTVKEVSGYSFMYRFSLPSGQDEVSEGYQYGDLPLDKSFADIPYQVDVEYIARNPRINRVKGLLQNNESVAELFRHEVAFGLMALVICCYLAYRIVKGALKEYKQEKRLLTIGEQAERSRLADRIRAGKLGNK